MYHCFTLTVTQSMKRSWLKRESPAQREIRESPSITDRSTNDPLDVDSFIYSAPGFQPGCDEPRQDRTAPLKLPSGLARIVGREPDCAGPTDAGCSTKGSKALAYHM
jgi:hypothetical protein